MSIKPAGRMPNLRLLTVKSWALRRAYDSRGGERVPGTVLSKRRNRHSPENSEKEGFDFKGWYSDEKCQGQPWSFGKAVTAPSILYAKWEKSVVVPEKEPEPEKDRISDLFG